MECSNIDCRKAIEKPRLCPSCKVRVYCSQECRLSDWYAGHQITCGLKEMKRTGGFTLEDFIEEKDAADSVLGKGSFGEVHLVTHQPTGQKYALKSVRFTQISKMILQREGHLEVLKREITVHTNLCHPNIIRLYDHFEDQNKVYLLLELANRGSLFFEIHRRKGLPEDVIRRYFKQTCEGIKYLHENDIIHRDIKPENLLIDSEDNIKICDFGWCVRSAEARTTFCGTLEYMAPEMILGGGHSFAIDIWALGVLLFEMAHGRAPFAARNESEKCQQILTLSYQTDPTLSPALTDLIHFMLRTAPEERPNIASVLAHPWITAPETFQASAHKRRTLSKGSPLLAEIAEDKEEEFNLSRSREDELLRGIDEWCRSPRFASPRSGLMNELEKASKKLQQSLAAGEQRDARELKGEKVIMEEEEEDELAAVGVLSSAQALPPSFPQITVPAAVPQLEQVPSKRLSRHSALLDEPPSATSHHSASESTDTVSRLFEQERESIDSHAKDFYNEVEGKWANHSKAPSVIEAPEARKSTHLQARKKGLKILEEIDKLQNDTRRPVPELPPLKDKKEDYADINRELAFRKQRITELMNAPDFHTSTVAKRTRPKRQEDSAFFRWLSSVFGCTDR